MERFQDKWKMESLQFCKEEFYESFRAPRWTDLSDPDCQLQPDDTTWFCTLAGCDQNHSCFEEMLEQTISLKDPSPSSANGFNKSTQKAKTTSSKSRTKSPSSSSSMKAKFRTPMKEGSQIGSARKCLKSPENENPNHSSNLNVPNPEATPFKDSAGDSQNPSDSPANLRNAMTPSSKSRKALSTTPSSKSRKALSTPKTKTSAPSAMERKAPRCMKNEFRSTKKYQQITNNHRKNGNGQLKTPLTVPIKKGFCESKTAQVKERASLKGSSRCSLNNSSSPSSVEANTKGNSVAPSDPSPCIKLNFARLGGGNEACPQTKDQGRNDEFKQEDLDKRHSDPEIDMQKLELAEESEEQDAWKENIVEVETFTDSLADLRTEENVQTISGCCNEVKSLQQGEGIETSSERPIACHGMGKDFENVELMEGRKTDYLATNLSENLKDKALKACDCVTAETKDPKKLVEEEILNSTTGIRSANSQSQLIKTDQFSVDEFSVSDSSKHLLDASDADIPNSTTPHTGKSCSGMDTSDKRNKGKDKANQLEAYEGKIDEPETKYERQSFQEKKLPQPKPNETLTHEISTIKHAKNPRTYDVAMKCDKMVKGCQQPNYGSSVQKSGYGMRSPMRCSKEKLSRGSSTKKSITKMTTQLSPNEIRKKTNITCPKPFRFRTEERRLAKEANLQATAISQTPTHLPQSKSPNKLKMSKEKLAQVDSSPSKSKTLGSLSKDPLSHNQRRISGLPKFYTKMKMPKYQTSFAHHQNNTPFSHSHFPTLRSTNKITSPKKPNLHPEHTKDCIKRAGQ